MLKLILVGLLSLLLALPSHAQQLPDFNIGEVCARGAEAVSKDECGKDSSSVFCAEAGRHAIEALCIRIDQDSKSELLQSWDTVPFEQKRKCIIYVFSEPFLSYSAIEKCINGSKSTNVVADGPAYAAEYWYGSANIIVPMHDLEECNRTKARAGNLGFCVERHPA